MSRGAFRNRFCARLFGTRAFRVSCISVEEFMKKSSGENDCLARVLIETFSKRRMCVLVCAVFYSEATGIPRPHDDSQMPRISPSKKAPL